MYSNLAQLLALAEKQGVPLWRIILENEKKLSDISEEGVFALLHEHYQVMTASATKALDRPMPTVLGLISGIAAPQYRYSRTEGGLCGGVLNRAMAYALSCSEVNASMGRICAAPTAGACGILPRRADDPARGAFPQSPPDPLRAADCLRASGPSS